MSKSSNKPSKIFFDDFGSAEDVFREFAVSKLDQAGIEFIYANYDNDSYEGEAFIIFRRNNELFEVNGSHCSCNGLEECWSPEKTTLLVLLSRPNVPEAAKDNLKIVYQNIICFA